MHTLAIFLLIRRMETGNLHFLKFVRRIRRRMVLLRWLERTGLAIFAAALASMLCTAVLAWHGQSAIMSTEVFLSVGFIAGTIWALFRPVTMLQAALRIDEQSGSAEIFSTAWACSTAETTATAPWIRAIRAMAEERCQPGRTPNITLHRLGTRAWAMICLGVGGALTLSAFFGGHSNFTAESRRHASYAALPAGGPERQLAQGLDLLDSAGNRPVLLAEPEDLQASKFGQNSAPPTPKPQSADSQDANHDQARSGGVPEAGRGGGSARTSPPNEVGGAAEEHGQTAARTREESRGNAAAGTGLPSAKPVASDARSGMTASVAPAAQTPPPWSTPNWPADVQNAQRVLSGGSVPADYRDLIREYFAPNAIYPPLSD